MRSIVGTIERGGPFAQMTAMAPHKFVEQLRKAKLPVPAPITIRVLLDTGASESAVDSHIISRLGLLTTGRAKIHTPTSGSNYEERDQYGVSLYFGSLPGETAEYTVSVIESSFASEGFMAIIGWDVLSKCVLLCDGPQKTFRLDY
jgi:hypothetical protein